MAQPRATRAHQYCPRLQMDDRRLVAGCADGTVKVADLRRAAGTELHVHTLLPAHRERVRRAGPGRRRKCKACRCAAGRPLAPHPWPLQRLQVWALALSETRLISAALDGLVIVRSFAPGDAWQAGEPSSESDDGEGSLASTDASSESEAESEEEGAVEGWADGSDSDSDSLEG